TLLLLVLVDGDAAAVIGDGAAVVRMQDDVDPGGMAGDRLVHRGVDDLVDEMVQCQRAGRPDVHAGSLAHRLEALEHGDVLGPIGPALPLPLAPGRALCSRSRLLLSQKIPSVRSRKTPTQWC